ncbi:MAG: ankyrin repeat domain-containing protein [Planctomycetes bacterium]|nr:ankyrin repeat domain-containing protein [Planctomycetota bacterium]
MACSPSLHQAVEAGDLETVRQLIAAGGAVDQIDNGRFNVTPLLVASRLGHLAIVRVLIKAGAQVNHADHDGFTSVNSAARAGHWEVVKFLIWEGADVTAADATGGNVHDYLRRCRSQRVRTEVQAVLDACCGGAESKSS